jgi:hypothetical protein
MGMGPGVWEGVKDGRPSQTTKMKMVDRCCSNFETSKLVMLSRAVQEQ